MVKLKMLYLFYHVFLHDILPCTIITGKRKKPAKKLIVWHFLHEQKQKHICFE